MTDEGGWSGLLPAPFRVVFSWCDVFVVLVEPEPSLPSDDRDGGKMVRELLPSDLESIEPACWKGCSEPPRRWPVEASMVVAVVVVVVVLELTGAMAHQSRSSGCREERGAGMGAGGSRSLGVLAMSKSEMGRRACNAQRRSESTARAEAGAGFAPRDGSGVAPASWWRVPSSESLPGVGGPTPSGFASLLPFA